MSQSHLLCPSESGSSLIFQLIFDTAPTQLTKKNSFKPRSDNEMHKQWLAATANVLCAFSAGIGDSVALVKIRTATNHPQYLFSQMFSPGNMIFACVCV